MKTSRFLKRGLATLLSAAMGISFLVLTPINKIDAAPTIRVDPSNLTDWITYDHYYNSDGTTTKPLDWASRFGGTGDSLHPYYNHTEQNQASVGRRYYELGYNAATNKTQRDAYQKEVLDAKEYRYPNDGVNYAAVHNLSQHIYPGGDSTNAEVTFIGYGRDWNTDFILKDVVADDVKSIGFDMAAVNISAHTIDSFGALFNAGITADNKLTGYMIAVRHDGRVYLVDLTAGYDVDALHHGGTASGVNNHITSGKYPLTDLGTVDLTSGEKKIRVDLVYTDTQVLVKTGHYPTGGGAVIPTGGTLNGTTPIALNTQTGHEAFGLFTSYKGNGSHNCAVASWIRFSFFQASVGATAYFWKNLPTDATPQSSLHATVEEIKATDAAGNIKSHSIKESGKSMPAEPTLPGYRFVGWSTASTDPNLNSQFTEDTPVSMSANVYAIWQAITGPGISLSPTTSPNSNDWYNSDVTVNVTAQDSMQLNLKDVKVVNNTVTPISIPAAGNSPTYNESFVIGTEGINSLVGTSTNVYDMTATAAGIIRIDKTAPVINGMPQNNSEINSGNITVTDPKPAGVTDVSEVDTVTYTVTPAGGGAPVASGPNFDAILDTLPTGKYDLKVEAVDKAGNPAVPKEAKNLSHIKKGDEAKISVTYFPNGWTNENVTATITIEAGLDIKQLIVDGKVVPEANLTKVAGSNTTTTTFVFEANRTNVPVELETIMAGYDAKTTMAVTWIDKAPPTVTNLPDVTKVKPVADVITPTDYTNNVVFTDFGSPNALFNGETMSQINEPTITLKMYKVENKRVSDTPITIPWVDLVSFGGVFPNSVIGPGRYFYDIEVADNAGNVGKASDKFGGKLINEGGTSSGTEPGEPNNGRDKGVLIPDNGNPAAITITPSGVSFSGHPTGIVWYKDTMTVTVDVTDAATVSSAVITDVITSTIPATTALSSFVGQSGTLSAAAIETANGVHEYTVVVKAADQTIAPKTSDKLGVDGVDPTLSIRKNPTTGSLGTNLIITATDKESGIADDKYEVTVIGVSGTATPAANTKAGTEAVIRDFLDKLPNGTYEVALTVEDFVGHVSNTAKGTFTHDDGKTPVDEGIKISYDPDLPVYTKGTVEATIKVVSKEKITNINVNGTELAVAAQPDGVTFIGTNIRTANGSFPVTATTVKGDTIKTTGNVTWIDQAAPVFSNFPKPSDYILTAADVVTVGITDRASTGGTAAGVDRIVVAGDQLVNGTAPYIELYLVSPNGKVSKTATYTFDLDSTTLAADWANIASGKYLLNVIAYDKAIVGGNEGKSGLIMGNGLKPTTPIEPGDTIDPEIPGPTPPYIINPPVEPIKVEITGTNPVYEQGTWINENMAPNKEVEIFYEVESDPTLNIDTITTSGAPATVNPGTPTHSGSFKVNESGTHTVTANDTGSPPSTGSDSIDLKIDWTKPHVDGLNPGVVNWDDVILVDDPGPEAGSAGASGVDQGNSTFIAENADGDVWTGTFDEIRNLPPGTYEITITSKDKAGNTNSEPFTGIIVEPNLPPKTLDIQVTYDKNTWTNQNVIATVKITSNRIIEKVTVPDANGSVDKTYEPNEKTFTFNYQLDDNTLRKMEVFLNGEPAGTQTTKDLVTTWIDKLAPIAKLNTGISSLDSISVQDVTDPPATSSVPRYGQSNVKQVNVQLVGQGSGSSNNYVIAKTVVSGTNQPLINAAIKELIKQAPTGQQVRIEILGEDFAGNIGKVDETKTNDENASDWYVNATARITGLNYKGSSTVKAGSTAVITILTGNGSTSAVPVNGQFVISTAFGSKTEAKIGSSSTQKNASGTTTITIPTGLTKGKTYYINVFNNIPGTTNPGEFVEGIAIRIG